MERLQKLIGIGGPSIGATNADPAVLARAFGAQRASILEPMLSRKNGFYAFEGALHVLSATATANEKDIFQWNEEALWRASYDGMANNAVYFAEDVFGVQFCLHEDEVSTFDPETGAFEAMASNLDDWADEVLEDYNRWSGYSIAHDWQRVHGKIPEGTRLLPITPFVLGGEFSTANLRVVESTKGMRYRASIAVQIRDLPDGTPIKLRVMDE